MFTYPVSYILIIIMVCCVMFFAATIRVYSLVVDRFLLPLKRLKERYPRRGDVSGRRSGSLLSVQAKWHESIYLYSVPYTHLLADFS